MQHDRRRSRIAANRRDVLPAGPPPHPRRVPAVTPRRLVIVRAGEGSLHPRWTTDRATRRWDLVVSYFGSDPARFRDEGDPRIDDAGQKWHGLHALLTRTDFWRSYDHIWLPDDDLAADQGAIDRLFDTMHACELVLAQPALSWGSFHSHAITVRHPSFTVRLTNFVEIMAPCFSRDALERCLPTFTESLSGWGLDFAWPALLDPGERIGIVDAAEVTHTRPVGGPSYARLRDEGVSPHAEYARTLARHGLAPDIAPLVTGGIDARGRVLACRHPHEGATVRGLIERDWLAYQLALLVRTVPASPRTLLPEPATGDVRWRQ